MFHLDERLLKQHFVFKHPSHIEFGWGVLDSVEIHEQRLLCLCSPSILAKGEFIAKITDVLSSNGTRLDFIEKSSGEPDSKLVDELFREVGDAYDAVLGIGGGSVLDAAKYIAMLTESGGLCTDYEFGTRKIRGAVPLYLIPTTSGSGSEVTPYSVVKNSETGRKFTISHPSLFPQWACVDPILTMGLPYGPSLASGLDAFIHNLEVLMNRQVNALITPIAVEGLRLGFEYLPCLQNKDSDQELRQRLSYASLIGGFSIAQVRTGLIHTLSVAISEFTELAHGLLNAMLLPFALKANLGHFEGYLSEIVAAMTDQHIKSDTEAYDLLCGWTQDLVKTISGAGLGDVDIKGNLDHLVGRVLQDKGLPEVNIGPVTEKILYEIFEDIAQHAS